MKYSFGFLSFLSIANQIFGCTDFSRSINGALSPITCVSRSQKASFTRVPPQGPPVGGRTSFTRLFSNTSWMAISIVPPLTGEKHKLIIYNRVYQIGLQSNANS